MAKAHNQEVDFYFVEHASPFRELDPSFPPPDSIQFRSTNSNTQLRCPDQVILILTLQSDLYRERKPILFSGQAVAGVSFADLKR